MSPLVLFLLAIVAPFGITLMLLGPIYAGIFAATYIVYMPETGTHPLLSHASDVFYIIDVYAKLFDYWSANSSKVDFVDYTLPVIGAPALGIIIALYGTYKLTRGLLNLFRLSVNNN